MPTRLITLLLIFTFPAFISADYAPKSVFVSHYIGTKHLWDARMGKYTDDELNSFVFATYLGTNGNEKLCCALAGISILECGSKRFVRDKTGHLGGHLTTIRVGAKEVGINKPLTYQNLRQFTPYERTLSLSRHFAILYGHFDYNLEKTCRVWNLGPKWNTPKAKRYWYGVLVFSKIYDSSRMIQ